MKRRKPEYLKINFNKPTAVAEVWVVDFWDHDHRIAYIPSLQLSAYGKDSKEARNMLIKVVMLDFFDNLLKLPESRVSQELRKLGWQRDRFFKKKFRNSKSYIDKQGILKSFNLSPETEINEQLLVV